MIAEEGRAAAGDVAGKTFPTGDSLTSWTPPGHGGRGGFLCAHSTKLAAPKAHETPSDLSFHAGSRAIMPFAFSLAASSSRPSDLMR